MIETVLVVGSVETVLVVGGHCSAISVKRRVQVYVIYIYIYSEVHILRLDERERERSFTGMHRALEDRAIHCQAVSNSVPLTPTHTSAQDTWRPLVLLF